MNRFSNITGIIFQLLGFCQLILRPKHFNILFLEKKKKCMFLLGPTILLFENSNRLLDRHSSK